MKLNELDYINENIDLDSYIQFREEVKNGMDYPEWLGDLDRNTIKILLENQTKIWIYYDNHKPVCSMMMIKISENDIKDMDISADCKEVVEYGPMFVHPKYRGNKLQFQMLQELDNYCINLGYQYALATIHPDNIYSINNLVNDGFKWIATKEFARGTRNIYLKKY